MYTGSLAVKKFESFSLFPAQISREERRSNTTFSVVAAS